MNSTYRKIAAGLAFFIGGMSIFAGGQVLFGKVMDYYVIDWLVVYNVIVGLISAFITAILVWKGGKFAMPTAITTLASHGVVMLVLQTVYRDLVAPDSVKAMTARIVIWIIVLSLMVFQDKKNKNLSS